MNNMQEIEVQGSWDKMMGCLNPYILTERYIRSETFLANLMMESKDEELRAKILSFINETSTKYNF